MNGSNCSNELPYSSDLLFGDVHDVVRTFVVLGTLSTCVTVFVCVTRALLLVRQMSATHGTKTLILLFLTPSISIFSMIGLYIPRSHPISILLSSLYLSLCIWFLCELMFALPGGTEELLKRLGEYAPIHNPPLLCCCRCLPKARITRKFLFRLRMLVMQIVVLKPLASFITACLWADGRITTGALNFRSAFPYVSLISGLSTLVAMYGLISCFRLIRPLLPHFNMRAKFVVVQVTLICCNFQPILISLILSRVWVGCTAGFAAPAAATYLQNFLLTIEMLGLGLLSFFTYRRIKPDKDSTNNNSGAGSSALHQDVV